MADVEAFIAPCIKHLVYLIVSFDIDSNAAGRNCWADFKGQEHIFRTIKCMVLQCQGIRLEIQGLPGLGQAEKKTSADMFITFQNFHVSFKFLGYSETFPLGSFHPWLSSK